MNNAAYEYHSLARGKGQYGEQTAISVPLTLHHLLVPNICNIPLKPLSALNQGF